MNVVGIRTESNHAIASRSARAALFFGALLHASWIGAWLLEQRLEAYPGLLDTSGARFLYWLVMKILLWLFPATILIRYSGLTVRKVIGLYKWRAILVWGGGTGLVLGGLTLLSKLAGGQLLFSSGLGWPLLGGVIIAPVVEEFTFRGAILTALRRRLPFPSANTITALLFLGIHLPGWYFQGRLAENIFNPVGGALSIFLLGWAFGYVSHKSESVAACTVTHVLNNLFNA